MGGHADINNFLLLATVDIVDLGFNTLLHDVDIAWKANPFPYLEKAVVRRDFLAMEAPRSGALGPVNSGFVFIRPTKRSKVLLHTLENLAALKRKQDQVLWNSVIKIPAIASQLSYRILPLHEFRKSGSRRILQVRYEGLPHSCSFEENEYLVYHAVGNDKKMKLIEQGLWFFRNGVCHKEPCFQDCGDALDTSFLPVSEM